MAVDQDIDSAELVHVLLSNESTIVAQVGSEIYGPPGLPEDFTPQKTIVFLGEGGMSDIALPKSEEEFAFFFYAENHQEARELYRVVKRFFDRKSHRAVALSNGTGIFQYARKTGGPQDRTEPIENWPYVYATFIVHFMERTIA